jgi:hypothetical protein
MHNFLGRESRQRWRGTSGGCAIECLHYADLRWDESSHPAVHFLPDSRRKVNILHINGERLHGLWGTLTQVRCAPSRSYSSPSIEAKHRSPDKPSIDLPLRRASIFFRLLRPTSSLIEVNALRKFLFHREFLEENTLSNTRISGILKDCVNLLWLPPPP